MQYVESYSAVHLTDLPFGSKPLKQVSVDQEPLALSVWLALDDHHPFRCPAIDFPLPSDAVQPDVARLVSVGLAVLLLRLGHLSSVLDELEEW
jgi:hypothetical protein